MQLILLSGGSGKRLWPLSNSARSKQFLPLLAKPGSTMESMLQRVVRQITETGLDADITIATNTSQLDIIYNQLGESVDVVTEPERRDTFPAIALATSYLALEKKCPKDEVVVVMPCDPYTENGYFETIGRMATYVQHDHAELVLMGITPTYPSEKFGYIVADTNGLYECKPVKKFTEKPAVEVAEGLLKTGAVWNGGVFAFKLGYMMDIVRKYVSSATFAEVRANYTNFPKISFDYEVVEKAQSVGMVSYSGAWKDLGTWNSLTGEIEVPVIGNAVVGPHCEGVHVINELQNPIFVDGLSNVVVAASPDGILVCAKEHSEDLKKHVENLSPRPMYEEKRWGTYRVLDDSTYSDGTHAITKSITIKAGKSSSYHIHRHRAELWTFVQGEGVLTIDGEDRPVKSGETVRIPAGHWHSLLAVTELTLIEVQQGWPLVEDDVERK